MKMPAGCRRRCPVCRGVGRARGRHVRQREEEGLCAMRRIDRDPGFLDRRQQGEWKGLDVDMCRAIAATMFGDASKFKVTPLNTQQRFTALQSGEVDVLTRNTTVTLTRDTTLGLIGVGVNYYDSQGVMVSKELGVKSAKELNGATVCVQPGTTTELNLADWFRGNKIEFKPVVIDKYDEIVRAFSAGRCDAFTTDKSQLASTRTTLESPITTSSCRRTSRKSRSGRWCARATSSGSTSCAGRSTPCWRPRNTESRPRTSTKWPRVPTPTSSAFSA